MELHLNTLVRRVDRGDRGWRLDTDGGSIDTDNLVIATGFEHTPVRPEWPGREAFEGTISHSAEYRNPAPYAGKRVLVVGAGTSGFEISHELADGGAAEVWLSVRSAPDIVLRKGPGPLPGDFIAIALYHTPIPIADAIARAGRKGTVGDLSEVGLPAPTEGLNSRGKRLLQAPAILDPEVIESVRNGSVRVVANVDSLSADGVRLVDGTMLRPDAIICATGFRAALEPLVGHLGVLNDRGLPRTESPDPAAPGLWLSGYGIRPAYLGYLSRQASRTAERIARSR